MSKHDFEATENGKVDAPDYKAWKQAGVELVIFRATCGDGTNRYLPKYPDVDPSFSRQIQKASAAGLHVGAYHLLRPGQDSATQARLIHKTVTQALRYNRNTGISGVILALDVGVPASTEATHPHGSTPAEIAAFINELYHLLRVDGLNASTGVIGIYPENKDTATIPNGRGGKKEIDSDFLTNLRLAKEPARSTISGCWLWGSNYTQREPDFTEKYKLWGRTATIHQYSGGRDYLGGKAGKDGKMSIPKRNPETESAREYCTIRRKWNNTKWPIFVDGYELPVEANRLTGKYQTVDEFVRACAFKLR